MQKFFAKVLENTPEGHNDLVSYLLFDREYLEALIQLGFEDARAQHEAGAEAPRGCRARAAAGS